MPTHEVPDHVPQGKKDIATVLGQKMTKGPKSKLGRIPEAERHLAKLTGYKVKIDTHNV